jgi:hypothetical protein
VALASHGTACPHNSADHQIYGDDR